MQAQPNKNLAYFTAAGQPLTVEQDRIYLPFASDYAMKFLDSHSDKGFFLMVEGSQIDWGGHNNDSEYIINEMLDFDRVVGKVMDFAEKDGNTLVIVTADHETGGYSINYGSTMDKFVTGFTTDYHTATMIPVFAYGPGAESFAGIYDNTRIFHKMLAAYGFVEK
jgi:alkaline phosphatase